MQFVMKIITMPGIDEKLHKKAKEMGIDISAFLNIKLREYIALIEAPPSVDKPPPAPVINKKRNGPGGIFNHHIHTMMLVFLNPRPLACEASDLPLIYRPDFNT